jgi:hypothetical protein
MGFIPVLRTTFGLAPVYGNNIWLHALLAIAAGYFGWVHKPATAGAAHVRHERDDRHHGRGASR